jgi:hypothetical protein
MRNPLDTSLGIKMGRLKGGEKVVVSVKPGSFCEGLLFEKDLISHVDGIEVRDMPLDEFVGLFAKNEKLELMIVRAGTPRLEDLDQLDSVVACTQSSTIRSQSSSSQSSAKDLEDLDQFEGLLDDLDQKLEGLLDELDKEGASGNVYENSNLFAKPIDASVMISPDENPLCRTFSCGGTTDDQRSIKAVVQKRVANMDAHKDLQRTSLPKLDPCYSVLASRRARFQDSSRRFSCGECGLANLIVKGAVQKRTRHEENWAEDRSTKTASKLILEQNSKLAARRRRFLPQLMTSA